MIEGAGKLIIGLRLAHCNNEAIKKAATLLM